MCTTPTSQGGPRLTCSWKQVRRGICVISYQLVARAPKDLPLSPPQSEKQWSQSWSGGNLENVAHGPRKPRNARRQRGTIRGHLDHSRGLSLSWRPTSWRHQKQLWSEPKKLEKNPSPLKVTEIPPKGRKHLLRAKDSTQSRKFGNMNRKFLSNQWKKDERSPFRSSTTSSTCTLCHLKGIQINA